MVVKKNLSNALYILCLILMLGIIIIDIFPAVIMPTTTRILCSAVAFILVFAATIIKISYLENAEEKIKAVKFSLCILFIFYSANLLMLLFVDMTYGRTARHIFNSDVSYKTYFKANTNFIPFKGIVEQYERIKFYYTNYGILNLRYAFVNIAGNLAAFAPMGFFIPALFKRINNLKKFALLIIFTVIFVELMQFITKTGVCDVDDVILNSLGTIIVYIFIQTKFAKNILHKLHINV